MAILLALAYLGAATKAGTFLAEKVVRPVFEQLGVFAGDRAAPEASSSPEGTVSYTAPAMDFYFLQVGVYASQENAETEAKSIQSQGGAGYVYQDKEDFRVILSAYTSQDDAETVQQRIYGIGDISARTEHLGSAVFIGRKPNGRRACAADIKGFARYRACHRGTGWRSQHKSAIGPLPFFRRLRHCNESIAGRND